MGQYFKMVNLDKREYLVPWCCGDGAKLVEITTGNMPSLITYLLKQSSDSTGCPPTVEETKSMIKVLKEEINKAKSSLDEEKRKNIDVWEKQLKEEKANLKRARGITFCGRWAGDRITLVGDYDDSKLYDETDQMNNITHEVMEEYNQFVSFDECRVFTPGYHTCEKYRSKEEFEELVNQIPNYKQMIAEGRCSPASYGEERIDKIKLEIDKILAEDEYYGKYKEPKWQFQRPKSKVEPKRKGLLAPDMVLSVGGNQ